MQEVTFTVNTEETNQYIRQINNMSREELKRLLMHFILKRNIATAILTLCETGIIGESIQINYLQKETPSE